jgi:hypothetical protein
VDLNKQMPVVFMSVVALAVSFTAERIHANDVVISEIMAANDATLADEDGDYPDWVEFHNRGTTTVNLGGWYVTDSEEDLQKWRFPEVELAPKSFLTVFCSGKDRADPSLPLHTSFKLSADGEFLALLLPDGRTIVSQLSPGFPALPSDVSYGFPQDLTEFTILASGAQPRLRRLWLDKRRQRIRL